MSRRIVVALAFALATGGCGGIFASSDVKDPRYFAPSTPEREKEASARPEAAAAPLKLRIGRVSSGEHLRQRIVFRSSPVEVGEYEEFRWTEKPEEFVRRALLRSLFEDRGLTQAVGGVTPTVDVEVLAFEEVRHGDKRAARVAVSYAVRDDRVVIAAHTVTIERDATDGDMERVVEAMSSALDEASTTIADEVLKALLEENKVRLAKSEESRAKEEAETKAREADRRSEDNALPGGRGKLGIRK